jgi:hypothetical protein
VTHALATADGWRSTSRAIPWAPLLAVPLSGAAVVLTARLAGHGARLGPLAPAVLMLTAAALAFSADDAVLAAAPASPTGTRARLAARILVVLPVLAVAWLAVTVIAGAGDRWSMAPVALGQAAVALAVAVVAGRRWPHVSPGGVGVVAAATAMTLFALVPHGWIGWVPSGRAAVVGIAVASLVVVLGGTREPGP